MISFWSWNDCKSPQISRTYLSILADINNTVILIITACLSNLYIFCSHYQYFGDFSNWLYGHLHVPCFFSSLARSRYSSLFLPSFSFSLWSAWTVHYSAGYLFLLTITMSGRLYDIKWSVYLFCITNLLKLVSKFITHWTYELKDVNSHWYKILSKFINIDAVCAKTSSSSYRAGSTDIPDPLSPLLPIIHRPRQVFRTTTCILT